WIISSLHELNNWPFREAIKHETEIIKGELAQVLSFQELIKFTAVMRFTCQSWGILHSEKRGELADQARGFSRVAAAPYPGYLLCRFFCRVAAVPYPAYTLHYRAIVAPVSAAPPGSGGVITPKWPYR
ncbi:hypothetical protein AB6V56_23075, partial [Klebsiella pneumoniae]